MFWTTTSNTRFLYVLIAVAAWAFFGVHQQLGGLAVRGLAVRCQSGVCCSMPEKKKVSKPENSSFPVVTGIYIHRYTEREREL